MVPRGTGWHGANQSSPKASISKQATAGDKIQSGTKVLADRRGDEYRGVGLVTRFREIQGKPSATLQARDIPRWG